MPKNEDSQQLYQKLMKDISSGTLLPVYFICGDEQFFTDRAQEAFIAKIPPEVKDFNFDLLYGQDVDIPKILNVAKSYPMMANRRFVVVREFFSSIRSLLGKEDLSLLEPLIHYIGNPLKETVLILIDSKKPTKTTKLFKALDASEHAAFYAFDHIEGSLIPNWIISWAKTNFNKTIQPDAAQLLYQITGTSLHQLSTELEKLCTFKKTQEPVLVDDVKSVVGFSREYTVFELKDAVTTRNLQEAIHIAEQLLRKSPTDTGEVIRNIAFFYTVFSNIWQYQRMTQKGLSSSQIDKHFGGSYRTRFIAAEAKRFRPNELPLIFETLLDADRAIKGFSKLDVEAIFIMMLRRIIT